MTELKKILVGIDPHQSRRGEFSPPTTEAAKQAICRAERMAGEIMFLSALEAPADDELYTLFGEAERMAAEVKAACQTPLEELVKQAQQHGVRATSKIVYGTGWMELTSPQHRRVTSCRTLVRPNALIHAPLSSFARSSTSSLAANSSRSEKERACNSSIESDS